MNFLSFLFLSSKCACICNQIIFVTIRLRKKPLKNPAEKSADSLMEVLLYVASYFALAAFKILSFLWLLMI